MSTSGKEFEPEKLEEVQKAYEKDWRERFEVVWEENYGDDASLVNSLKDFIFQEISIAEARGAKQEREKLIKKVEHVLIRREIGKMPVGTMQYALDYGARNWNEARAECLKKLSE